MTQTTEPKQITVNATYLTGHVTPVVIQDSELPDVLAAYARGEDVLLPVPLHPQLSGAPDDEVVWVWALVPANLIATMIPDVGP